MHHTTVIGLGCEGIAAQTIFQGIRDRGRSADVLTIQETGGTTLTADKAAKQLTVKSSVNDPVAHDRKNGCVESHHGNRFQNAAPAFKDFFNNGTSLIS